MRAAAQLAGLPLSAVLTELDATPRGLTGEQARARLERFGPNEIAEKRTSPLLMLLGYFWAPIPWMIEVARVLRPGGRLAIVSLQLTQPPPIMTRLYAAAWVSAGLVMHHYGSKDGLKDAVDRRAVAFFEEMIGELARIGEEGGSASLAELFAGRLESEPAMTAYVRRLLADGGEAADALFAKLFDTTAAGMRSLVATGVARPAQDERIRAAFLLANDLSLVLLRRQIARATGTDPLTREGLARWAAVVMDVYTGGVFAVPAVPGKPASDPPSAREGEYR